MRKSYVLYFFMILVPGYSLCQNIGIGTTTPDAKLHIKGSADTSQLVIDGFSTQQNIHPLIKLRKNDGNDLLWINSDDSSNVFIGLRAGQANTRSLYGYNNTFIGSRAGYSNIHGFNNTVIGKEALFMNLNQYNIVAIGDYALYNNGITGTATETEAFANMGVGSHALYSNGLGSYNTAIGYYALYSNTGGSYNTTNGYYALFSNSTGSNNTATGFRALQLNTIGISNTANGYDALRFNVDGGFNTATGTRSLSSNISGYSNTANGDRAMYFNSTGFNNTAMGAEALYVNTTGCYNTATGRYALYVNTTGQQNTATGEEAMAQNTTGSFNTAVGLGALYATTTSANNTTVGCRAGDSYNMGWNNTLIGANTDVNGTGMFNAIAVGESAFATNNNQARIGNSSINSIGGYANWTNISDGRVKKNISDNVPGLSFINKLQPITYHLDLDAADRIIHRLPVTGKDGKPIPVSTFETDARRAKEQIVYSGFIAQDVEKAAKEAGYDFSGVDAAKNDKDLYGLRYAEFVVPLVKAVQELSKQNEELKKQNEELLRRMEKLESLLLSKK